MTDSSTLSQRLVPAAQYTAPTTGSTINMNDHGNLTIIINPSGSLLALTLALNGSPQNGDTVSLASSQAVTTFSMTGGTVIGALTTLAIATFASYTYSSDAAKWFRSG